MAIVEALALGLDAPGSDIFSSPLTEIPIDTTQLPQRARAHEGWLRARERRTQKMLQSSNRNGAQRETADDTFRYMLQDT
jgi:hypothetical protein